MNHKTPFFDLVMRRLRACKHGELGEIAVASGVPVSTIRKLFYGEVSNPRIGTVEALHDYFAAQDALAPPPQEVSHAV